MPIGEQNIEAVPEQQATSAPGKTLSPRDYGVGNVNILQIPAEAFVPFNTTWTHESHGYFLPASGNVNAHGWAPVTLPSGAEIIFIDLYYDDTDASQNVSASLLVEAGSSNSATLTNIATAVSTGSSGKGYASSSSFSYTVNNDVQYGGGAQLVAQVVVPSAIVGFKAVDIWWRRQLSLAPLTPTFNDVPPNHPFYRVIEALAASGVTTGCGGGNFCPGGIVTRQELAKFISRALGLYWPDGGSPAF